MNQPNGDYQLELNKLGTLSRYFSATMGIIFSSINILIACKIGDVALVYRDIFSHDRPLPFPMVQFVFDFHLAFLCLAIFLLATLLIGGWRIKNHRHALTFSFICIGITIGQIIFAVYTLYLPLTMPLCPP